VASLGISGLVLLMLAGIQAADRDADVPCFDNKHRLAAILISVGALVDTKFRMKLL
jgi:hypothetical protein